MKTTRPPLTPQQKAALDARGWSVSLAAGAGCGKTFVLTERFITQLDPASAAEAADLDQLVAITFTDAAAREMRDRIRRSCYDRLQAAATASEAAAWQRLVRSMDAARISTIHAFCTALLRSHAVEAGLDPGFDVLDAAAAELLRLEVIDDRLRALLLERNDDVLDLAAARGLDRLRSDLADFVGARHAELIEAWRKKTPEQLVAHWVAAFETEAPELAAQELLGSGEIREMRRWSDPTLVVTEKVRSHLAELAHELTEERIRSQQIGASLDKLNTLARVQGVCKVGDWDSATDFERFKTAATKLRELIKGTILKKSLDLDAAHESAKLGLALVRLAADASQALDAAKARRNQLEFDDLLVRARRLLLDPAQEAVRQQTAERVQLLMVDEFQDTNPVQVDIIKAFCGERWRERGLFAVGDFKQSIYRFNGAKPLVSTNLRGELPAAGRLSLTRNFRSQPEVLNFINAVFHDAFAEYEPLIPARAQLTPGPAVEFLWSPGPKSEGDAAEGWHVPRSVAGRGEGAIDATTPVADSGRVTQTSRRRKGAIGDARAEEARWIARRIAQLIDSGEPVVVETIDGEPTARGLRLGDVAILLRSLSDAQLYEEALRDQGLDYYLAGGHAFYSQQEIYDVLNLLRAIASTVDDVALAGALRSPLFALADETLFWLVKRHGSLNAALAAALDAKNVPAELSADEAAKVQGAAATLDRLRREKDYLLVAELFALALDLTGYDATLLAEFLGPRKAANLEKLAEQARAVDRLSPGDLPAFITQLSEFVLQAPKEALAATEAAGGDVIRIMTIHYAKGLEFPLVVLPDLERRRHSGGAGPVLDESLGPLVPLSQREGAIGYDLYRRREAIEDLDERKRLFYVACTRAADRLILSSSIDDLDEPSSDWLQLVAGRVGLADGHLIGTLPAGYHAPAMTVITERPEVAASDAVQPRGADLHKLAAKTRERAAGAPRPLPLDALPVPPDAKARRRFSFSQLTGLLTPVELDVSPAEADESEVDELDELDETNEAPVESAPPGLSGGREFGVLVHAVLQRVDFHKPTGVRPLCDFLAPQLVHRKAAIAAKEATALIERFLQTPLAAELAVAPVVRRELEFVLRWPPAAAVGAGPYLHGYLDCLYQDAAGRWRLIDYKTNRVAARDVSRVVELYELQMLAYRLACEQALGEPLAECALVLLHPGVVHAFARDAAAEKRGVARITAAIKASFQTVRE